MSEPELKTLGPYTLGDLLGRGGMGEVYRAHDTRLGRDVALKVMLASEAVDELSLKRFLREMKVQASLTSPNIVRVLDVGEEAGRHYLAMELLVGRTLKEEIEEKGAMPPSRVLSIGLGLARGLAELHTRGMVHRDIKPQNVFLRADGQALLMDLGLVKVIDATVITRAGAMVGTPRYLPPEVIKGGDTTTLCDIYQLGLVLYEAATGRPAILGDDLQTLASRVLAGRIDPPRALNPAIGPALEAFLFVMVALDPARRPPDAQGVVSRLELVRQGTHATPGRMARVATPIRARITPTGADLTAADLGEGDGTIESPPIPVPASPGTRRPAPGSRYSPTLLIGAVGAALALVVAGIGLWHRRATPAALPAPSAANSAPGLASPPEAGSPPAKEPAVPVRSDAAVPLGLCREWKRFVAFIPRLRARGEVSHRAVATLQSLSRLDFGPQAGPWLHWLQLCQWLADPTGPDPDGARFAAASGQRLLPLAQDLLDNARFKEMPRRPGARGVIHAFEMLKDNPNDGRRWLMLGRVLERDGEQTEGLVAYKLALDLLGKRGFEAPEAWVWAGLARALAVVPGHGLTGEFLAYVDPRLDQSEVWQGLCDARIEPGITREEYRRILEEAVAHRIGAGYASARLGEYLLFPESGQEREPDRALKIWLDGIGDYPASSDLRDDLCQFYLDRGDLPAARVMANRPPASQEWIVRIRLVQHTPMASRSGTPTSTAWTPDSAWWWRETDGLLEDGLAGEVKARISGMPITARWPDDISPVAFELAAQGGGDERVRGLCDALLLDGSLSLGRWNQACGALVTPEGVRRMESALSKRRARGADAAILSLMEALWHSRRGQLDQAIARVEQVVATYPGATFPPALVAEILSRPIWSHAWRPDRDADLARRAAGLPLATKDVLTQEYWKALTGGDRAGAAQIAGLLLRRDPHQPIWSLVRVWNAAGSGNAALLADSAMRAKVCFRAQRVGIWALREVDAVEKAMGAR